MADEISDVTWGEIAQEIKRAFAREKKGKTDYGVCKTTLDIFNFWAQAHEGYFCGMLESLNIFSEEEMKRIIGHVQAHRNSCKRDLYEYCTRKRLSR